MTDRSRQRKRFPERLHLLENGAPVNKNPCTETLLFTIAWDTTRLCLNQIRCWLEWKLKYCRSRLDSGFTEQRLIIFGLGAPRENTASSWSTRATGSNLEMQRARTGANQMWIWLRRTRQSHQRKNFPCWSLWDLGWYSRFSCIFWMYLFCLDL